MGVAVLHDPESNMSCLYDNTSGRAFGPVMEETGVLEVYEFLELLDDDPRTLDADVLGHAWETWEETRMKGADEWRTRMMKRKRTTLK